MSATCRSPTRADRAAVPTRPRLHRRRHDSARASRRSRRNARRSGRSVGTPTRLATRGRSTHRGDGRCRRRVRRTDRSASTPPRATAVARGPMVFTLSPVYTLFVHARSVEVWVPIPGSSASRGKSATPDPHRMTPGRASIPGDLGRRSRRSVRDAHLWPDVLLGVSRGPLLAAPCRVSRPGVRPFRIRSPIREGGAPQ